MSMIENPRAFPSSAIDDRFGGMTLRDWFAGQALAGTIANGNSYADRAIAQDAYALADAMLAERDKAETTEVVLDPTPAFTVDMDSAPKDGSTIIGRLADGSEKATTWWINWPGWREVEEFGSPAGPVEPLAWRSATSAEHELYGPPF